MATYLNLDNCPDNDDRDYSTLLHYIIMHAEAVHGKSSVYYSKINKRYRISLSAMYTMLLLTATMLKEQASDDSTSRHTIGDLSYEFSTKESSYEEYPDSLCFYCEKFAKILKNQLANVHMDIMTTYIDMLKKRKKNIYAGWRGISD